MKKGPKKRKPKTPKAPADKKPTDQTDWRGSDFDSEEAYGSEGGGRGSDDEEGSFEMDDGHVSDNSSDHTPKAKVDLSNPKKDKLVAESKKKRSASSEPAKRNEGSLTAAKTAKEPELESSDSDASANESMHEDECTDPHLIRREATLLQLVLKQT